MTEIEQLAAAASTCQRCGLSERRTNVVFGEGSPDAPLMLIGEGPGEQEDKTGRPFVGRAGQLLDRALDELGIGRSSLYIANTVKCRAADWKTGKPVNRAPTETEIFECSHWLHPQIRAIGPLVILCVGAPSARTLIKKDFKITRERGRFFESKLAKAIMATLHPAYILRQANISGDGGYALFKDDIQKAWDTALKLREKGVQSPLRKVEGDVQTSLFSTDPASP